jgi:predicted RNase H-like HicB family nuclease
MSTEKPKVSLTAVFVEDPTEGGFTGFFKEFPNAIAEGETQEEAQNNLFKTLSFMLQFNREENETDFIKRPEQINVIEKSFDLEEVA